MLANLLAVIVGLGSLGFYLVAFILPEVHRRSDFFWSGVGMFYAVVLWYCARQMHGAVLLGQTSSVGLLLWLGYQTLLLRRETTPAAQQTPIRLGKSERSRFNSSRPLAKDYEFVEDGVEDVLDMDPDPDSPILIKPEADEFALKMVVPAAIPTPVMEDNGETQPVNDSPVETAVAPKSNQTREKPNPVAAIGIFTGWLREVVTPKKKASQPMIELPPRPPSIPKVDSSTASSEASEEASSIETFDAEASNLSENRTQSAEAVPPEMVPSAAMAAPIEPSAPDTSANAPENSAPAAAVEPIADVATAASISSLEGTQQQEDEEESNWPEDEFWD